MIRVVCTIVVSRVAGVAVRRKRGVIAADMATGTGNGEVSPGQRESCLTMIERRRRPRGGRVAD